MSDIPSSLSTPSSSSSSVKPALENAAPYVDTGSPLPEGYGRTSVYLLPRDPFWMFSYWEVTEQTVRETKKAHGEDIFFRAQPTLRMHEISKEPGGRELQLVDVPVRLETKNWYLNTDREGSSWYVELGLKTPDGKFIFLAKSNSVGLPRGGVSNVLDEQWATLQDEFEKVFAASGGGKLGTGSLELTRLLSQRWALLSQGASWKSGSHFAPPAPPAVKPKGFWLVADCDLRVYGATEPDAAVTVAGQPVPLYPDGTFSLRFALPDGKLEIPIKAVSGDQTDERTLKITVERKTDPK